MVFVDKGSPKIEDTQNIAWQEPTEEQRGSRNNREPPQENEDPKMQEELLTRPLRRSTTIEGLNVGSEITMTKNLTNSTIHQHIT